MVRTIITLVFLLSLGITGPAARADEPAPEQRALDWLVAELSREDPLGGKSVLDATHIGKRYCAKAVTAFVLETHPERERYREDLERLEADLLRLLDTSPLASGLIQPTWLHGFLGLWLAEKGLRGDDVSAHYEKLLRRLSAVQNAEGGWSHGMPMTLPFYPTTIVAATNWALLANGAGQRVGVELDKESVTRGVTLLENVQGDTGAFPYGGSPYRKGYEAGRTAGSVAALAALGRQDSGAFRRAAAYILRDPAAVPRGHASPSMHVLMGALAFRLLGDDAWALWEEHVLAGIRGHQRADGTFDILVTGAAAGVEIGMRDTATDLYVTSCCAAALAMPRSRLAAMLAAEVAIPPAPETLQPSTLETLWWADAPSRARLSASGGRALLCSAEAGLESLAGSVGTVHYASRVPFPGTGSPEVMVVAAGRGRVYVCLRGVGLEAASFVLVAFELTDGTVLWSHELPDMPLTLAEHAGQIFVPVRCGGVLVLDAETGTEHERLAGPTPFLNYAFGVGPNGNLAVASQARLRASTATGKPIWERNMAPVKGVMPAAWCAVTRTQGAVVGGRTDGTLEALAPDDGRTLWSVQGAAGITAVQALGATGPLLVQDFESAVRLVSGEDGSDLWRFEPPRRHEQAHPLPPSFQDGLVVVPSPGDERTFFLDPETGGIRHVIRTSKDAQVAVDHGVIFVLDHGRLWALRHADRP